MIDEGRCNIHLSFGSFHLFKLYRPHSGFMSVEQTREEKKLNTSVGSNSSARARFDACYCDVQILGKQLLRVPPLP